MWLGSSLQLAVRRLLFLLGLRVGIKGRDKSSGRCRVKVRVKVRIGVRVRDRGRGRGTGLGRGTGWVAVTNMFTVPIVHV